MGAHLGLAQDWPKSGAQRPVARGASPAKGWRLRADVLYQRRARNRFY
jgi:hypothetical protein